MRFTKMQAFGNDYVYIDVIHQKLNNPSELARFISNRHLGVGADGMVLICPSDKADFQMRIFNPDGTEAEMCGNALRSVGKYVYDHGLTGKREVVIETLGGIKFLKLFVDNEKVSNICADIGEPILSVKEIPVYTDLKEFIEQPVEILGDSLFMTAVSWGNPHCVIYVDSVKEWDVEKYGSEIENKTSLFPNKTNVTFAELVNRNYIKIREWERGTGETIGCGTGCATAVVAGVLTNRCERRVTVEQIGGILEIEWDEVTNHLIMVGPSYTVYEGEIFLPLQNK
ncbi:MAG: diaminopimelate epimerase [Lachnospiraceae bacterium]|nr:diaminopimelate epimerase [Lachnospiraceae bacterium]